MATYSSFIKNAYSVMNYMEYLRTTAGYKNTYSYNKLIQLLVRMVIEPEKAFIAGGSWRIPVAMGLQNKSFIEDLKRDSTFNEASFEREFESKWSGTIEDAFFNGEHFDRCRKLLQPEYEHSGRSSANSYYIISVDVGRRGQTESCPLKIFLIAGNSYFIK